MKEKTSNDNFEQQYEAEINKQQERIDKAEAELAEVRTMLKETEEELSNQ